MRPREVYKVRSTVEGLLGSKGLEGTLKGMQRKELKQQGEQGAEGCGHLGNAGIQDLRGGFGLDIDVVRNVGSGRGCPSRWEGTQTFDLRILDGCPCGTWTGPRMVGEILGQVLSFPISCRVTSIFKLSAKNRNFY